MPKFKVVSSHPLVLAIHRKTARTFLDKLLFGPYCPVEAAREAEATQIALRRASEKKAIPKIIVPTTAAVPGDTEPTTSVRVGRIAKSRG